MMLVASIGHPTEKVDIETEPASSIFDRQTRVLEIGAPKKGR